jgi:predicted transcriptional regulator
MDMTRQKKMVSYALDPELLARLDKWLRQQEFPPSKTAVIERSLSEFLDNREARDARKETDASKR